MGTFGLLVGISLLLQGMNQFILSGVGYDDLSSGEGNTLYQLLGEQKRRAVFLFRQPSGCV